MKIISWNVWGLGGFEKRREVCNLVREKKPLILCIQETKLVRIDVQLSQSLWGGVDVEFSFQPSIGASGGLLSLWDSKEVVVWSSWSFEHVLVITGSFEKTREQFVVFNVYAPCDATRQQVLWVNISNKLLSVADQNVCICSVFNVIRCAEERRSVGPIVNLVGNALFNQFIVDNSLIDLPLRSRRYTWFRGDGRSMSRIDRVLLSESWCLSWPGCCQMASARGLSDHCPLILSVDEENWGPKPSRMLKCWENFAGYNNFVCEKWNAFQVDG